MDRIKTECWKINFWGLYSIEQNDVSKKIMKIINKIMKNNKEN